MDDTQRQARIDEVVGELKELLGCHPTYDCGDDSIVCAILEDEASQLISNIADIRNTSHGAIRIEIRRRVYSKGLTTQNEAEAARRLLDETCGNQELMDRYRQRLALQPELV